MHRCEESDAGAVRTTDDGHWIVVDGRRWRAADPDLDPRFRAELVAELMQARRDVRAARSRRDVDSARRRVHWAKVALGERGEPWWQPSDDGRRTRLAAVALTLAGRRGPEKTICPSDVARTIGGTGWRARLDPARDVLRALARSGWVEILQRGEVVDADRPWKGPVRVRSTHRVPPTDRLEGAVTRR